jgi:hypothetical protein
MITLSEVEARTDVIRLRIEAILKELRANADDPDRVVALAEEMEALIAEAEVIYTNLSYFEDLREHLLNEHCSGPH